MKTFKFSVVLCTPENTDVFITLDDNIYSIHSKSVNILFVFKKGDPSDPSNYRPISLLGMVGSHGEDCAQVRL